jgi:hypothetical protein
VENPALTSGRKTPGTRGSSLPHPGAGDRRADWARGRRLHSAHRTHRDAPVSRRRCSLATSVVSGRGLARHRLLAVSLFSLRARQRSTADQGCSLCTRRPHHAAHRAWKVLLHFGNSRQRNPAWARRTFRSSWCRHCFSARPLLGITSRKSEGTFAGRRGGGNRSRFQHAPCCSIVCARRDCRRPPCSRAGLSGACLRYFLGSAPPPARQQPIV